MKNLRQIDWARLAAYIDGEGTIDVHKGRQYNGKPNLFLRVCVVNTDPRLPAWCRDNFGGTVSSRTGTYRTKFLFKWDVGSKRAKWIIENCLSHFVIKREQAEVALEFCRTIGKQGKPLSSEVIDTRLGLKKKLSDLKTVVGDDCSKLVTNSIQ